MSLNAYKCPHSFTFCCSHVMLNMLHMNLETQSSYITRDISKNLNLYRLAPSNCLKIRFEDTAKNWNWCLIFMFQKTIVSARKVTLVFDSLRGYVHIHLYIQQKYLYIYWKTKKSLIQPNSASCVKPTCSSFKTAAKITLPWLPCKRFTLKLAGIVLDAVRWGDTGVFWCFNSREITGNTKKKELSVQNPQFKMRWSLLFLTGVSQYLLSGQTQIHLDANQQSLAVEAAQELPFFFSKEDDFLDLYCCNGGNRIWTEDGKAVVSFYVRSDWWGWSR